MDLTPREILTVMPLILMAIWMGVFPGTFLRKMDASMQKVVDRIEQVHEDQVYRVGRPAVQKQNQVITQSRQD